jgi:hypothetical protein
VDADVRRVLTMIPLLAGRMARIRLGDGESPLRLTGVVVGDVQSPVGGHDLVEQLPHLLGVADVDHGTGSGSPLLLIRFAVSSMPGLLLPAATTTAPERAKACAVTRPMAEPVTRTTWPEKVVRARWWRSRPEG